MIELSKPSVVLGEINSQTVTSDFSEIDTNAVIDSFIQQKLIGCLLCSRHGAGC